MNYYSEKICPFCNSHLIFTESEDTIHYGRLDCPQCRKWICWVRNPNKKEKNRYYTSIFSIQDVSKFHKKEKDICFLCLREKKDLGKHETLTVDHIEELDKGGKDELENLQNLCSACHKLKNWLRLYLNWHLNKEGKNGDTKTTPE